jgi:hypothetical protein
LKVRVLIENQGLQKVYAAADHVSSIFVVLAAAIFASFVPWLITKRGKEKALTEERSEKTKRKIRGVAVSDRKSHLSSRKNRGMEQSSQRARRMGRPQVTVLGGVGWRNKDFNANGRFWRPADKPFLIPVWRHSLVASALAAI